MSNENKHHIDKRKITLGHKEGIQLKKPSSSEKKLRPPGSPSSEKISLRKPTPKETIPKISLASADTQKGSIPEKKEKISLTPLGEKDFISPSSITLRVPSSSKISSDKGEPQDSVPNSKDTESVPTLKKRSDASEITEKSHLETSGDLQLKKAEKESSAASTGLRLRKRISSISSASLPATFPELTEPIPKEKNEEGSPEEDSPKAEKNQGTDASAIEKDSSSTNLGLVSRSKKPPPEVTLPGVGSVAEITSPEVETTLPKADSEDGSAKNKDPSSLSSSKIGSDSIGEFAVTEDIQFSRKRKIGMTKKEKIRIALIAIPVFFLLGFLVFQLSKGFITLSISSGTEEILELPSKKIPKKKEMTSPNVKDEKDAIKKIYFPQTLLNQLEKEQGKERKEKFVEYWDKLSHEKRKSYLEDIGYAEE